MYLFAINEVFLLSQYFAYKFGIDLENEQFQLICAVCFISLSVLCENPQSSGNVSIKKVFKNVHVNTLFINVGCYFVVCFPFIFCRRKI